LTGSAFYRGAEGEKLLRFCFAKDDDVLEEASADWPRCDETAGHSAEV